MTHLEQLHLDAIYGLRLVGQKTIESAEAAAEITENIACEFADWLDDYQFGNQIYKLLFQEYLKTKP
jgi:hypothetical protein